MANRDVEVAVIGGGAAGIAAARTLHDAGIKCLILEARSRLGGRAWTIPEAKSHRSLDLGCGWLHSADRNPWSIIAGAQGFTIDKTPPPWTRSSLEIGFPIAEQALFRQALNAFYDRVEAIDETAEDVPAASCLSSDERWNPLLRAVATYVTGAELDVVSAKDLQRYDDSGVNWRVAEGYGALVACFAHAVPTLLNCAVQHLDHTQRHIRLETTQGSLMADAVVVTLPSTLLAEEALTFSPKLPMKTEAASGLPLGLADKLFLSLTNAEEFEEDTRLFGSTSRTGTATYHFRPFGGPYIETYFAGDLAHDLERNGPAAFFEFAKSELIALLGAEFARRIQPISMHCWGSDPLARGSYSYASVGHADQRQLLAIPVDDRIFFAGEACSAHDFSTAHGAHQTGVAAAKQIIAIRGRHRA